MKKILNFLFKTDFGPFLAWMGFALLFLVGMAASPFLGSFANTLEKVLFLLFLAASAVPVAALFNALKERRYGRAIGQFFLICVGILLFVLALAFTMVACMSGAVSRAYLERHPNNSPWIRPQTEDSLPFFVEFRHSHPFLAEYDKRIVFNSGKTIGLWPDTGGAGPFAVYALSPGEYYIVDGLEHDFIRNDYRVNTSNETVEIMCDKMWFTVPDGTASIDSRGSTGIGVETPTGTTYVTKGTAVEDSVKNRKYLGKIHPNGKFVKSDGADDPYADIIDPPWTDVKLPQEIPFSLSNRLFCDSLKSRITFKSGKTVEFSIFHSPQSSKPCSVYSLADGCYHLVCSFAGKLLNEYRINPKSETLELRHEDKWLLAPDGTIDITGWGESSDGSCHIYVLTDHGNATGEVSSPVENSLDGEKLVGALSPRGTFLKAKERKP